jgi:hypothetical protein
MWQRAQDMRAEDYHDLTIAKALNLTEAQVRYKFTDEAHAQRACRERIHLHAALTQRDALFAIPRSLTASVMGDPLPGRSALDKLRAGGR